MASLWKHPQSRYWTACFTDANGRQRKRSTKETNRAKALKIAHAYERAARTTRTAQHVRRVIEDIHEEITGESLEGKSVRDVVSEFLDAKKQEVAENSLTAYSQATRLFLGFLEDRADMPISQVARADIVGFRNHQMKSVSARTANNRLKCLRMVFRAARQEGLILEDPTEFVKAAKQKAPAQKRVFTKKELGLTLDAADDEWRSMILFGLYTGQRLSDIALLDRSSIDLQKQTICLQTKKTGRRQIIPIAGPLLKHIKANLARAGSGPVHPRAHKTITSKGISAPLSRQFAEILEKAGLRMTRHQLAKQKGMQRNKPNLSFHCLRHTTTTWLHEAGVPAAVAQELVGHDSEAMHQIYVNVGEKALAEAAEKLPEV